jgi:hypothetical protein
MLKWANLSDPACNRPFKSEAIIVSELALIVTIEFESGSKEEVLRALLEHHDHCIKEEAGALQFEVLVPLEDQCRPFFS